MGNREAVERDHQLAAMAYAAARQAEKDEEAGRLQSAAQMYATAAFLLDCMATRPPRFRGRATQRMPSGDVVMTDLVTPN